MSFLFDVIIEAMNECIVAQRLSCALGPEGLPSSDAWHAAEPATFCHDWRGENADPQRQTETRLLWSPEFLFIRFDCSYREIFAKEGSNRRRDELWMEDVAEIFIQRSADELHRYREFEVSPGGDWLDLEINARQRSFLMCALRCRVVRNPEKWIAEMGIPIDCLTPQFAPRETWRLNLFSIEGPEPNRFYSSWSPTYTPKPDFHRPEHFGKLLFASS
jgi:hypothetical protein